MLKSTVQVKQCDGMMRHAIDIELCKVYQGPLQTPAVPILKLSPASLYRYKTGKEIIISTEVHVIRVLRLS
jgi:hypothetical protein